jgi:hypothetical protein
MVNVSEETMGKVTYTNISLTRGDDCVLVLPIYTVSADGTRTEYTPTQSDTFAIQVREAPITKSGTTPAMIFSGTTSIESGKLNWTISHTNSTQNCGKYYWDAQITTNNKVYTFYQGWFQITPEATV